MGVNAETTEREAESSAGVERPQSWLRWVFPADTESVALVHGLVIGRDEECAVQLGGNGVSRRHVEFHRQGPLFALKDLGSTNGTFLGGRRVEHAPIVPGAVLRVGEHVGVFGECVGAPREFQALALNLFGGHELDEALSSAWRAAPSNISVTSISWDWTSQVSERESPKGG